VINITHVLEHDSLNRNGILIKHLAYDGQFCEMFP